MQDNGPLRVLVVEDSREIVDTIRTNLNPNECSLDVAVSFEGVSQKLDDAEAVILDLNLDPLETKGSSALVLEGLEVLTSSLDKKYKLVIVFSAFISQIDRDSLPPGPFVEFVEKGTMRDGKTEYQIIRDALAKFKQIKSALLKMRENMDGMYNVALKRFQEAFPETNIQELEPKDVEAFVSFRMSTYLQNMAVAASATIPSQAIFIVPPLTNVNHQSMPVLTGDIFQKEKGETIIVISPSCDLVTGPKRTQKTCNVLVLHGYKDDDRIKCNTGETGGTEIDLGKKEGLQDYFVPPEISDTGKLYITLKNPSVIPFYDLINDYNKVGTIASPFVESLQADFARELGRLGVPELLRPNIKKKQKNNFK